MTPTIAEAIGPSSSTNIDIRSVGCEMLSRVMEECNGENDEDIQYSNHIDPLLTLGADVNFSSNSNVFTPLHFLLSPLKELDEDF